MGPDDDTAAVTAPAVTPPLNPYKLAQIAHDMAIHGENDMGVLVKHTLTEETLAQLRENPFFIKVLETAKSEWHSIKNTSDRLQILSALTLEQLLPHLHARATNDKESLNHVVEFAKMLAKAGGIGDNKREGTGEKLSIHIDLGGEASLKVEKERAPIEALDYAAFVDEPSDTPPVQQISQGQGQIREVQQEPQGPSKQFPVQQDFSPG